MSLSDEQWLFIKDLAKLTSFAENQGFKLTLGEGFRTQEQQDIHFKNGATTLKRSRHQSRLAQDYNTFVCTNTIPRLVRWRLIKNSREAQALGNYWEGLSLHNIWGGNWASFPDAYHFERRRTPRKMRL